MMTAQQQAKVISWVAALRSLTRAEGGGGDRCCRELIALMIEVVVSYRIDGMMVLT